MKILITCPPMINRIATYKAILDSYNFTYYYPHFTQTMTEQALISMVPTYDGWIVGDDPVTNKVIKSGKDGQLKAIIKWGVGTDNIDIDSCNFHDILFTNTPHMFGEEVSDIAIGYLICLTRHLHVINERNKQGIWYKPCGLSLNNKKVCLIGFGDIGRCVAKKLIPFNLDIYISDPKFKKHNNQINWNTNENINIDPLLTLYIDRINITSLNQALKQADYVIITCELNKNTYHLLNKQNIILTKKNVKIINVSRGQVINEKDVIELQNNGFIESIAFDVFEEEPLVKNHSLLKNNLNMFGSHNGSNTEEAVDRTSKHTLKILYDFLCDI